MPSPIARLADTLDRRIGRRAEPPNLWPTDFGALVGHAAVAAFLVLAVTGFALAVAYRPSTEMVTYTGSSELYDGRTLPHAFASVVRISNDLPGGGLLRGMHVAASHLFVVALVAHLLRILATGAFRHPRLGNHLVGVGLLLVALGFGYTGELMPFTLLASSSLRIGTAIVESLPLIGEPLSVLVFGRQLPSDRILIGAWTLHVLLLPLAFAALLAWHLVLIHRRSAVAHRRPGVDVEQVSVGRPLWPDAIARFGLLGAALTTMLLVTTILVPWSDTELEGPFYAAEATNSVHPTWPLFFTTGSLRVIPAINLTVGGIRITNVLVAGVIVPGILVSLVAIYPFLERWWLDDRGVHHGLDHPLAVPLRAATVAGVTTASILLSLAAGVDVLSFWLHVPVELVVNAFRIALLTVPVTAAVLAARAARHRTGGVETARRAP